MSVQGGEAFEGLACFREVQPTVGEHAIHIKKHHADALRLKQQFRGEVQCGLRVRCVHQITLASSKSWVLTAPHNWLLASITSTLLMR